MAAHADRIEEQMARWRNYLRQRQAIHASDVEELEAHLRDQMTALASAGLDADEAFLVAVKRMGNLDEVSREFAREHSERLWKQLVASPEGESGTRSTASREIVVVVALAAAAGLAVKLPELFGYPPIGSGEGLGDSGSFHFPNLSFFVLPFLAGYFAWKRRLDRAGRLSERWRSARPRSA